MKNYLFAIDDEKVIIKAEDMDCAYDVLREEFGDVYSSGYLGWCTDEVAKELGYEVYPKPPKGMTVKDFYEWAVKNGVKDCPLRAFNPYINEYDQIRKTDVVVQALTDNPEKSVYIYLY